MLSLFDSLREFSFGSVMLRLTLALLCGGVIGYGRARRDCRAGIRTYMLISLGAALSVLITLYEYQMLHTAWADTVAAVGERFDASRLASQVITGVGFLGAGMIIRISHQQVKGLTTATGLFAAVSMSLAAGAGFVECVVTVVALIVLVLNVMAPLEDLFRRRMRNMALNVEMDSPENVSDVVDAVKKHSARVHEVDLENPAAPASAVIFLELSRDGGSHTDLICSVAELECVRSVQEIIS